MDRGTSSTPPVEAPAAPPEPRPAQAAPAVVLTRASPTFLGAPRWRPGTGAAAIVVGGCSDLGTWSRYARGTAAGPDAIRQASQALGCELDSASGRARGWHDADFGRTLLEGVAIQDAGDVRARPGQSLPAYLAQLGAELRRLRQDAPVVLLGGDHSLTLAAVRATGEPALGILHVDAHTDLAPVRAPTDLHHGNVMRYLLATQAVRHVVQVGLRGLLPVAPDHGLDGRVRYDAVPVRALRASGWDAVARLCESELPWYVTVDIDALDPAVAPSTPVPVAEGLGLSELRGLLHVATLGRRVVGADVVEVLGGPGTDMTASAAVQVALQLVAAVVQR